jgi:hypothetical protein
MLETMSAGLIESMTAPRGVALPKSGATGMPFTPRSNAVLHT